MRRRQLGNGKVIAKAKLFQSTVRVYRERSHRQSRTLFRYIDQRSRLVLADRRACARYPIPNGMISIKVPPLGESIVEATVSRWLKNEGDEVAPGETLVELETDKVTVEVPSAKAGVLVRRLRNEGDVVSVDELLAEVDESGAGARGAVRGPRVAEPRAPEAAVQASRPPVARSSSPDVRPGAPPARTAPAARRVAADAGIDLGSVAGTGRAGVVSKPDVLDYLRQGPGATPSAPPPPSPPSPPPPAPSAAPRPAPAPTLASRMPEGAPERPRPRPDVDIVRPEPPRESSTSALGPRADALRETREKMSTRRKRIAEHLLQSQHATAHLTTFNEIDMTAVDSLRGRLRERIERDHGVKLTFMPFFVRAACVALRQFPMVNAQVDGEEIVYRHYVNMGIAVASDAGLVVPNVKDADAKGLIQVGREIADLARKARENKLTMDDLTGGTFTITNGGVFGSLISTPIINYPQVAILGLHKIQDRPMVVAGQVEVRPMMYVALSYDHRIIDGQHAVLFLVRLKELLEEPAMMVVD
jgi:2-oxoglutarate dehydrogenase E2 component (dihydrolipoamide succinyltransferase)